MNRDVCKHFNPIGMCCQCRLDRDNEKRRMIQRICRLAGFDDVYAKDAENRVIWKSEFISALEDAFDCGRRSKQ